MAQYTDKERNQIEGELLLALGDGLTRSDACAVVGIAYATFLRWLSEDAGFERYLRVAEIKCKQFHLQRIKTGERTWQSSAWFLERKWSREFGREMQESADDKRAIRVRKIVLLR